METALYILHVLVCLAMLPIILLQSGKGGGVCMRAREAKSALL